MKRPEGFDKTPAPSASPPKPERSPRAAAKPVREPVPIDAKRSAVGAEQPASGAAKPGRAPRPARPPRAERPSRPAKPAKDTAAKDARRELRRARAERRRYEKAELRRFTRRQRTRRIAIATTLGTVGLVVVVLLVAIFSPILALRTITVEGAQRVSVDAVRDRLSEQLGTPLALLDYGRIDAALREFPVIRSYTTETIPPDTVAVRSIERQPVVAIDSPTGGFGYVDAAGVAVEQLAERAPGVPLLVVDPGTVLPNPVFDAAVGVLQSLPDSIRPQVDTITATSRDDVWLTLTGTLQAVKWGSADDSARKAELLAWLLTRHGQEAGTFDVSAITNAIFRPAPAPEPAPEPAPAG